MLKFPQKLLIFTGAHGVGKTSLVGSVAECLRSSRRVAVIPEVARGLVDDGYAVNYRMNEDGFIAYMTRYLKAVSSTSGEIILSDRSLIDLRVYTKSFGANHIRQGLHDLLAVLLEQEVASGAEYVYVPIEFEMAIDGVRPDDLAYQRAIDEEIRRLLVETGVRVLTVTGDLSARTEQVLALYGH